MIIKSYQLDAIKKNKKNFYLLYGKNNGLKKEISNIIIEEENNIINYEEKEILDNPDMFIENVFSGSLFENKKVIIIKRASDKIFKTIEEIINKNLQDLKILIETNNLDKNIKTKIFIRKK